MKEIIQNILDIENKANRIIDEGIKEKQQLIDEMNADLEKMRNDINAMVETKLNQLDKAEKAEASASIDRINKTAAKRLEAMDSYYQENRDSWVDSVFNIVVGSEKRES
ncbi:MAG TPA: hypothetical protein PLP30_06420 [Clostridia bacterium]|nr:hypothetical protein [Clostridia bacterium]HPQ46984.1 hypothetical protein [Clostridia bacterium]